MRIALVILFAGIVVNVHSQVPAGLVNGVAVIVNDAIITYRELQAAVEAVEPMLRKTYENRPDEYERIIAQTKTERLDDLVERKLILHEFETGGYNLPESFIEDNLRRRIREDFDGDRLVMTKTLQAQGITYETYRQRAREQFIVMVMRSQNVPSKIQISPFQIEMYYLENRDRYTLDDQVKLRMFYINRGEETEGQPDPHHQLAREIIDKIRQGASFADMASLYSMGTRASKGGNWGWVDRSVPRKELAEVAFSLSPGEMSELIDLPNGYYLLQVEDKRPAHIRPLSEVREEIEIDLRAREIERLRKKWIGKLRAKSFVRYF